MRYLWNFRVEGENEKIYDNSRPVTVKATAIKKRVRLIPVQWTYLFNFTSNCP